MNVSKKKKSLRSGQVGEECGGCEKKSGGGYVRGEAGSWWVRGVGGKDGCVEWVVVVGKCPRGGGNLGGRGGEPGSVGELGGAVLVRRLSDAEGANNRTKKSAQYREKLKTEGGLAKGKKWGEPVGMEKKNRRLEKQKKGWEKKLFEKGRKDSSISPPGGNIRGGGVSGKYCLDGGRKN